MTEEVHKREHPRKRSIARYNSTGHIPNLREFHAFPGESPTFRSPILSQETIDLVISKEEAEKDCSTKLLLAVFRSKDPKQIEITCRKLTSVLTQYDHFFEKIVSSEDLISSIVEIPSIINSEKFATSYFSFLLSLLHNENPVLIDAGIIFNVRELMETYPQALFSFYTEIPSISVYARNAMVCGGIISDVVEFAKKQEQHCVECAHVLYSIFKCPEPVSSDDLEVMLPEITSLLFSLKNEDAVYYVVHAIVVFININLVTALFDLNVHKFIADSLSIPRLTRVCVCLTGNMAVCDTSEIQLFIQVGVIQKLLEIAFQDCAAAADSYWALSNCLESAPKLMIPEIPLSFLTQTLERLRDVNINENVRKDAVYFFATLMLYSPQLKFHIVVSKEILTNVIHMLHHHSQVPKNVLIRYIDSIGRVLFVGLTNEKMRYIIQLIIESNELVEILHVLAQDKSKVIGNKAKTLICEIDVKKKELSGL
ncbi:hypothetical protein TRFO_01820 [Tritrichomonas foetus]|uniref:Uncharacterized protein n=1 Tax=Tritrichomonas foetus TaxID=1144522 RepID=A0A1J4JJI9_9EUKA|nr:hypothetical protein TRFO_01820 [Tritrichomonas foetus]|eukprot:OHS98777.1 hypothetical protein TRFO_01820 [Tritrichomonas foetus]